MRHSQGPASSDVSRFVRLSDSEVGEMCAQIHIQRLDGPRRAGHVCVRIGSVGSGVWVVSSISRLDCDL